LKGAYSSGTVCGDGLSILSSEELSVLANALKPPFSDWLSEEVRLEVDELSCCKKPPYTLLPSELSLAESLTPRTPYCSKEGATAAWLGDLICPTPPFVVIVMEGDGAAGGGVGLPVGKVGVVVFVGVVCAELSRGIFEELPTGC